MNLLVLDTSTRHAALAILDHLGQVHVAPSDPDQRHGRQLVPAIRDLLHQANLTVGELSGVAVGLGPGSYTGLRVGLTAAKTLVYALNLPLVGFDSLEAIAQNAPADASRVSVVADAQRGDLYVAEFTRPDSSEPLVRAAPTRIVPAADWLASLDAPTLVLGPGLERLPSPLPADAHSQPVGNEPEGKALVSFALNLWESGHRVDPMFLEPHYLRRSAAEEQWDRRGQPT